MSDFKETCIWMSYRYAIGRKSISAVSHARDIAQHVDWISENRREFTAKDIINEVNDRISWYTNIHIEPYFREDNDIFSVLFDWFLANPQEDMIKYFVEHEWHVNLATQYVEVRERENPPQRNEHGFYYDQDIFNEYSDYKDWINLARFLKGPTHIATVEYEGKVSEIPVIEWYSCNTWGGGPIVIEKCYTDAKEFPKWRIAPEYITNIKPIK